MPIKSLDKSIGDALMEFYEANGVEVDSPPDYLVEAVREEIEPVIRKFNSGSCDHKLVGKVIWETAVYVLRDMTDEETKQYASLMYGTIGVHGHLDK